MIYNSMFLFIAYPSVHARFVLCMLCLLPISVLQPLHYAGRTMLLQRACCRGGIMWYDSACMHEHFAFSCHSSDHGVAALFMGCALFGALLGMCGACTHPEPV